MFLQVSDRIFQGIIVDDISLGGLTVDSAITNLDYNLATKIKDKPVITLNYNNKTKHSTWVLFILLKFRVDFIIL